MVLYGPQKCLILASSRSFEEEKKDGLNLADDDGVPKAICFGRNNADNTIFLADV